MAGLFFEDRVFDDLAAIFAFIGRDSPEEARRFIQKIKDQCRKIAQVPYIGREREDVHPGLRSIAFGRYLIFYKISADAVYIHAVIHGARDIRNALENE